MTLLRGVVVVILFLCLSNSVFGQNQSTFADCPQALNASSYELWGIQLIEDCNAAPGQLEALRPAFDGLLVNEDSALLQSKLETLRSLRERVLSLNARSPLVSTQSVDAFALALSCDINQLENSTGPDCDLYGGEGRALQVQKWQTLDASGSAYKEIFLDVFETLSPGCLIEVPDATSACHTTMTEQLIPVLELYNVMSRMVLPSVNRNAREGVVDRFSMNHLRWKHYVLETGFQYPWELVFNKRRNGGFSEVVLGRPAPEQRWVLLHPTAGLYHSESLEDGSQTDLLGVVKLIGKKYWKYAPDNRPRGIIGLSLTSTFADIQGIEDVGYGLMVEYNGFGLGISRHGNQQLIVFNLELNNFILSRPTSFRQWLSAGEL